MSKKKRKEPEKNKDYYPCGWPKIEGQWKYLIWLAITVIVWWLAATMRWE